MAVEYISSGAFSNGLGSCTPGKPSGTLENHVLILHVSWWYTGAGPLTLPSGFTLILQSEGVDGFFSAVAWKRATASEPSTYTCSLDPIQVIGAGIAAYSGCLTTSSPINTSSSSTTSNNNTHTVAGITTGGANYLVLFINSAYVGGSSASTSSYSGTDPTFTERHDVFIDANPRTISALADGVKTSAGATGDRTCSVTGSLPDGKSFLVSLIPGPIIKDVAAAYSVSWYTQKQSEYAVDPQIYFRIGGTNIASINLSTLSTPPVGSVDNSVKGPNTLYITTGAGLRKLPDSLIPYLLGTDIVYSWSAPDGSSGKFLYRQDLESIEV